MQKVKRRKAEVSHIIFSSLMILSSMVIPTLPNCKSLERENRERNNTEKTGGFETTRFRYGQIVFKGGVFLLRGVNLGEDLKRPPFFPEWLTKGVIKDIASTGLNIIRLVVVWEGIEPERDKIDTAYISKVKELIMWAEEFNIHVLVDFHQDIFSRKFGGDGAPFWAVLDDGIPFERLEPWYLNYTQPAVLRAFENFYKNKDGIQDEFLDAVRYIAKELRGLDNVIGFEPMNEPFPPSLDMSREALDRFERELLVPFYDRFRKALAEEGFDEKNTLIFFEPAVPRTNFISPSGGFSTGFSPEWVRKNFVFAPHIYEPEITITKEYRSIKDKLRKTVENLYSEAKRLGVPMWIGEFGIEKKPGYLEFFDDILEIFDEFVIGWAVWTYAQKDHPMSFFHYREKIKTPTASRLPCNIDKIEKPEVRWEFHLDCIREGEGIFNFPEGSTWWSSPELEAERVSEFSVKFKFSEGKYIVFFR